MVFFSKPPTRPVVVLTLVLISGTVAVTQGTYQDAPVFLVGNLTSQSLGLGCTSKRISISLTVLPYEPSWSGSIKRIQSEIHAMATGLALPAGHPIPRQIWILGLDFYSYWRVLLFSYSRDQTAFGFSPLWRAGSLGEWLEELQRR